MSRAADIDSPSNRPLSPRKAKSLWGLHNQKGQTVGDLAEEFKVPEGFVRWKVSNRDNKGKGE